MKFQVAFGAVFTGVSLLAMPLSFIYGWQVFAAMLGPLIAGVANLIVGLSLQKKMNSNANERRAILSPEARLLLATTLKQMGGWRMAWSQQSVGWQQFGQTPDYSTLPSSWGSSAQPTFRSCKEILNERAFCLLDEAARECNRIQACVTGTKNQAVQKRTVDLAGAADEGMAQVLQQASLLDRFPESGSAVEASARQQIESLREIAERLEALHVREPLLTERMGSSSAVDRVLDDLRLESLARQELSGDGQSTEEHHNA